MKVEQESRYKENILFCVEVWIEYVQRDKGKKSILSRDIKVNEIRR